MTNAEEEIRLTEKEGPIRLENGEAPGRSRDMYDRAKNARERMRDEDSQKILWAAALTVVGAVVGSNLTGGPGWTNDAMRWIVDVPFGFALVLIYMALILPFLSVAFVWQTIESRCKDDHQWRRLFDSTIWAAIVAFLIFTRLEQAAEWLYAILLPMTLVVCPMFFYYESRKSEKDEDGKTTNRKHPYDSTDADGRKAPPNQVLSISKQSIPKKAGGTTMRPGHQKKTLLYISTVATLLCISGIWGWKAYIGAQKEADRKEEAWFERNKTEAEAGDPDAIITLAFMYEKKGETRQTLQWLRKGAQDGHGEAQWWLARAYQYGWYGAPKDEALAEQWTIRAGDNGWHEGWGGTELWVCQNSSTWGDRQGGQSPSLLAARLRWVKRDAEEGHAGAMEEWAKVLSGRNRPWESEPVPRPPECPEVDDTLAEEWFLRSVRHGCRTAMSALAMFYRAGPEKDKRKGGIWSSHGSRAERKEMDRSPTCNEDI